MKHKLIIFGALAAAFSLFSCKGEDDMGNNNSKPNSYFPLVTGNMWIYKTPEMTLTEGINFIVGDGTAVKFGKTYNYIINSGVGIDTIFVREAENGDILTPLNDSTELPIAFGNPIDTILWTDSVGAYEVDVISTQAQVNGWTGLIEISTLENGNEIRRDFFKKGVGLIRRTDRKNGLGITLYSHDLN